MASRGSSFHFLVLLSILSVYSSGVSALNPAPSVINVPSTNPVTRTPNPTANTVTLPNNNPVTNPAANPTPPGGVPVATPGSTPGAPPATPNAPAVSGQSFCVAKSGAPQTALQAALDYACGKGADCSAIQQGGSCYNPNTLQNHASYAFTSYYLKNPSPTSCDFGGVATLTNANPSTGSCVFPTSSSSSSPPATGNPSPASPTSPGTTTYPPPTTPTPPGTTYPPPMTGNPPASPSPGAVPGSGPPFGMNSSNPGSGGVFPDSNAPTGSTYASSSALQPSIGCIILVISIITGKQIMNI